jgi:polyisoprenoid-binding protein YceI
MAARAGHDLTLEVTRWSGTLVIDPDSARSGLSITVDADSLEVRSSAGGVKPLTDDDRAEIRRNIVDKVLNVIAYPAITFASTSLTQTKDRTLAVAGDLAIAGVTRPVQFDVVLASDRNAVVLRAAVSIAQSRFGIRPFRALMGTLKVADDVEITAEARLRPA